MELDYTTELLCLQTRARNIYFAILATSRKVTTGTEQTFHMLDA